MIGAMSYDLGILMLAKDAKHWYFIGVLALPQQAISAR
jgi:hypothetical protein